MSTIGGIDSVVFVFWNFNMKLINYLTSFGTKVIIFWPIVINIKAFKHLWVQLFHIMNDIKLFM